MQKKLLLTIALLASFSQVNAKIWDAQNVWDKSWEEKFSNWVLTDYSEDIFLTGKYKGVPTDCADAVYAARIIFSYENSLPFSIRDNTKASSSKLIGHNMSRFDGVKDADSRVKRFLTYIFDMTNTKTLANDSYPVKIDREWVRAGGIWMRPRREIINVESTVPGHAELIKEVRDTGVIFLIGSTVPQANRKLKTTSGLVFMPESERTGLRNWLREDLYFKSMDVIPGFSLEQYDLGIRKASNDNDEYKVTYMPKSNKKDRDLNSWKDDITNKLKLRDESKDEMIKRYVHNVCAMVTERIEVIDKADKKRRSLGRCMNENEYDLYSTPSRDKRLKEMIKRLSKLVSKNFFRGITSKMKEISPYLEQCGEVSVRDGVTMSMVDAAINIYKEDASSDPNQHPDVRWGIEKAENLSCKQYY